MRVLSVIEDPTVVRRILDHLGLWEAQQWNSDAILRRVLVHAASALNYLNIIPIYNIMLFTSLQEMLYN
jgi:hypothetical protein